ncbi:MAG: bifunctional [glutamate--ammonia ligase]-adenylyl-L-tyrosine phosphorylase/[glutamate--ammonia-ligase] adenylyltransferase [Acidobacteriota bacterium]
MEPKDLILAADLDPAVAADFLRSYGFEEPEKADRQFQELVELAGSPEYVASAMAPLLETLRRSADPDSGLANFVSFVASFGNPAMVLGMLRDDPRFAELLAQALGGSPFLTQILLRNPEYAFWLLEGNRFERIPSREAFEREAGDAVRPFTHPDDALDALRRFRRRETLRIGLQDLLGLADLPHVCGQISDLADAVLQEALQLAARRIEVDPTGFAVVGLGKLGGRELNFSSDVDLLYVHADDSDHASMVRLAREFTRVVGELTVEGRLYRVDLRLRPMGRTGEIVYSLSASLQYYETWADTMDRLALIKSRPVAGDRRLGSEFVDRLQGFVFRKYLDFAAVEEIRWTKLRTDQDLRRRGVDVGHVKLGLGGIREIEFFVQSFQLLYGGRHPELRNPSTLAVLDRLVDLGFVNLNDYRALREAYYFLRALEHKLQLVHDLQTHSLPTDPRELARCARRMGYDAGSPEEQTAALLHDLARHNREVHRIFSSLFAESDSQRGLGELVLNPTLDDAEALRRLREAGVRQPEAVLEGLRTLAEAPAFPHSPSRVRNLLANLVPLFVERARVVPDARQMFVRLDRFCEALQSRAPLYAEMNESPEFARRCLTALSLTESLAETLILYPELLDWVAVPLDLSDPYPELVTYLRNLEEKGVERREALRRFRRRELFKTAVRELHLPGNPEHRAYLSNLAEACLEAAWERAVAAFPGVGEQPCALLALGKLGGRELAFHSDLDLVFLYDDTVARADQEELLEFLHLFKEELTAYTASGRAYEIDFRLRPEGRKAAEAVPLSYFRSYFETRAEAWERLAWAKIRILRIQAMEFTPRDYGLLVPLTEEEKTELRRIRLRKERELGREEAGREWDLKVGRGALLDLQFLVQGWQLEYDIPEPNLPAALDQLLALGFLDRDDWKALRGAAEFLFSLEMAKGMVDQRSASRIVRDGPDLPLVADILQFPDTASLLERYEATTADVRRRFEAWFGALEA